jgi:hypothetical protein
MFLCLNWTIHEAWLGIPGVPSAPKIINLLAELLSFALGEWSFESLSAGRNYNQSEYPEFMGEDFRLKGIAIKS